MVRAEDIDDRAESGDGVDWPSNFEVDRTDDPAADDGIELVNGKGNIDVVKSGLLSFTAGI